MGISSVIFEFDALSIIQAINEGDHGGEFGHIIQSIRDVSSPFSVLSSIWKGMATELPMNSQK